jgi:glutamate racemase
VLRAIRELLPGERLIYFGDQAHVPYGPRPLEQVRAFSEGITRYFLRRGARLIVVACNAASAAALHYLRRTYPDTPFVGMEPAVKPAAETSRSRVVGVLATPATFQGALYASVVERFAQDVTLLQHTCPGLVAQIEAGNLDGPQTRTILEDALHPMLARGIDTVVLGCTHYPFVIPLIQKITGPQVRVIDPAPAIARQVSRVIQTTSPNDFDDPVQGPQGGVYYTSGDPSALQALLPRLLGEAGRVEELTWAEILEEQE